MSTSTWVSSDLVDKITSILREVPDANPDHHMGRPFLTAYQIAIALSERYPEAVAPLNYPVGGLGTGQQNSLTQYVAHELSREIHAGSLADIEGGFLSNLYLRDLTFLNGDDVIESSLTRTQFTLSMFRFVGP